MEMRYKCGLCGTSTTNPTTIDWCEKCRRLVCNECQPSHRKRHEAAG